MRTQEYILQGKEVPAKLRGTKVQIRVPDSHAEAISLCGGNESFANGLFTDAWVIYAQGRLRRASAKDGATVESLQKVSTDLTYTRSAPGTPKTAKPATKVKSSAASAGNRIFERELKEPGYIKRGIENGFFEDGLVAEFQAWREAKVAAATAAAAPKTDAGNGAPAQATEAPKAASTEQPTRRPAGTAPTARKSAK